MLRNVLGKIAGLQGANTTTTTCARTTPGCMCEYNDRYSIINPLKCSGVR